MISRVKYRVKMLRCLSTNAEGVRRFFVLLMFLAAISAALSFVTPIFYKIFIDDVMLRGAFSQMAVVAAGYLGVYLLNVIVGYAKNWANYTVVNKTLYNSRLRILRNMLTMPFSGYETASIGDMKMRVDDDTNQIANFAGYQTTDYVLSYATMLVSAGILFFIDWRLALFAIAAIPVTFWLNHVISKREETVNEVIRKNGERASSWLHASIQGWREVKALTLEGHEKRKYFNFLHVGMLCNAKWINFWTARVLVVPKIKEEFFMKFGIYFIGGFLIMGGKMSIGNLLVFAMYYEMLSNAVQTVANTDADLKANMPMTDRLMESLSVTKKATDDMKRGIIPDNSNVIAFEDVTFAYPNSDNAVIDKFSLKIDKGERVAITGKSGSGKTTLLKLLTGMVAPTAGKVRFSGVDLSEISLDELHKKIGFVMQDNILFNTTIRENLLYGKNDATDSEMREACRKAFILDFIDGTPNGLDTVIGEKGIKLSGGQRQRLVLARLFLRDVDVFLFDEATSALDQYSENIVHDAIRSIAEDKTIIVVAHRESSIALCDRQIVI